MARRICRARHENVLEVVTCLLLIARATFPYQTGAPLPSPMQSPLPVGESNLACRPNDLIHGLCEVIHVLSIQARHTDSSILGHVDVLVLPNLQHLLLIQPREAEHADLLRDVVPLAGRAHLLEFAPQRLPHADNAPGHGAQVRLPLCEQVLVVEDQASDARAVGWGVADLGALQDGELAGDAHGSVLCVGARGGDEVEASCALAVETKVLGVGLGDEELESLLNEVADGPGVVVEVA